MQLLSEPMGGACACGGEGRARSRRNLGQLRADAVAADVEDLERPVLLERLRQDLCALVADAVVVVAGGVDVVVIVVDRV